MHRLVGKKSALDRLPEVITLKHILSHMIKKFNKYLSYKNNSLYLEETSLDSIKKKFSTPIYCYSLSEIHDNLLI